MRQYTSIEEKMKKKHDTRKALYIWVPILIVVVGVIAGLKILGIVIDDKYRDMQVSKIRKEVVITEDSPITLDLFEAQPIPESECSFITDISRSLRAEDKGPRYDGRYDTARGGPHGTDRSRDTAGSL